MTPKEALQEIINNTPSNELWYKVSSDYDEVNKLRITALRIQQGKSKMQVDTLEWFFGKFGYKLELKIKRNEEAVSKII